MSLKALAVALAFAVPLDGATAFRIDGTRVTVAGEKICMESSPPVASDDGGKTFFAVDHANQTWFTIPHPLMADASFCRMPYSNNPAVRRIKWSWTGGADRSSGKLSYTVTEKATEFTVDVHCTVAIDLLTTREHPRALWPAAAFFRTGLPAVDERIAPDLDAVDGFPLRIAVTVSKRFDGGKPVSSESVLTITGVETVPGAPNALCERPAHYRQGPPGRLPR